MESSQREDEFNKVKICDFGLSHICDPSSGKALAELKCGTMGYIAPEVIPVNTDELNLLQGNLIGPNIDLWSLGVVLYEMAAAYKPT